MNRKLSEDNHDFLLDEEFIKWRLFQTEKSDEYWRKFLVKHPNLKNELYEAVLQFDAVKINQDQLSEEDKKDIYKNVLLNIRHYKKRRSLRKISSIAAVLMIGVLSVLFFTRDENIGLKVKQNNEIIIGQTFPQEEIYLISGGKRTHLPHQSHIGLTEGGKAYVTDSTDAQKELLLTAKELNSLVVPYGKRANLTLSDGTEVWLNSGTQLDFPAEFAHDKREICVKGEIFIDVAHNSKIPFIVRADDMDIYVKGTSFNLSAYQEDSIKTVVLVEGKVKIETVCSQTAELLPDEKIEITGEDMTKESVNVSEYISWTKGIMVFNETPVSEILKRIGRYYNVQFESSQDIKLNDKTCSGKLFLSNNLDSVMTSVSVLSSTVYQRENNIIHITKK